MLNQMTAEICFGDPDDLSSATPALIDNGFEIERLDWTDPEGGAHVWINASLLTELEEYGFLDRVCSIVDPHDGCVIKGGLELAHVLNKGIDQ